jgi:hypothetical protein
VTGTPGSGWNPGHNNLKGGLEGFIDSRWSAFGQPEVPGGGLGSDFFGFG